MAKELSYYTGQANKQLELVYAPLTKEYNTQIKTAQTDPYYQSLLQGLEATKNREFAGIESRSAQRGVAYGNIPSQAQGAYLGEKYLPAVAEVKKTQMDYINQLKMKLAELRSQRAQGAVDLGYKLRSDQIALEAAAKDRAASAASSASDSSEDFYKDLRYEAERWVAGLTKNTAYSKPYGRETIAKRLSAKYDISEKQALTLVKNQLTPGWEEQYIKYYKD